MSLDEKVTCQFCEKETTVLFSIEINDDLRICEDCNHHMEYENHLTKMMTGGY